MRLSVMKARTGHPGTSRNFSGQETNQDQAELAAPIHFFSIEVTQCLRLYKAAFQRRDSPTIAVKWACK